MRALGYYRCSTPGQAKAGVNLSLEPDQIARYCAANGLHLVGVVTDAAVSGGVALAKRRGGAELLARAGEADVIVTTWLDRLFRDALDGLTCMRRTFPKLGVRVLCICDTLDLSTASGRFNATQRLASAEYERDLDSERGTRLSKSLLQEGRVYGGVPYGCVAVDGALYRAAADWSIRQSIVDLAATGIGLRKIAAHLRDQRTAAPNGGRNWSTSTLANLIASHKTLEHLAVLPKADTPTTATP